MATKKKDVVDRIVEVVYPDPVEKVADDKIVVNPGANATPTGTVAKEVPTAPAVVKPKTFAENIIDAMRKKNYPIDVGDDVINIAYVEGTNPDGTKNDNDPDGFYDVRTVVRVHQSGNIDLAGSWEATTEPGWHYIHHRINSHGAALIRLGYQKCWQVGYHHGSYLALVQTGAECEVYRDDNENATRDDEDKLEKGWWGINQHYGYDFDRRTIKTASAGCLVGRTIKGHSLYFMPLVVGDARFKANKQFIFGTTILDQKEVK